MVKRDGVILEKNPQWKIEILNGELKNPSMANWKVGLQRAISPCTN